MIIPGDNLRIFEKAITALGKVGNDIYMEVTPNSLLLKTHDISVSSYACFEFNRRFFFSFAHSGPKICQIMTKALQSVFNSLNFAGKEESVDKCEIKISEDIITFILRYAGKYSKTYDLRLIQLDEIEYTYDKEKLTNKLAVSPKNLETWLSTFESNDDILLSFNQKDRNVLIRNYMEEGGVMKRSSAYKFSEHNFDSFVVKDWCSLIFKVDELKSLAHFSKSCDLLVNIQCGPKLPILFTASNDSNYKVEYVVSTRVEPENDNESSFMSTSTAFIKQPIAGPSSSTTRIKSSSGNSKEKDIRSFDENLQQSIGETTLNKMSGGVSSGESFRTAQTNSKEGSGQAVGGGGGTNMIDWSVDPNPPETEQIISNEIATQESPIKKEINPMDWNMEENSGSASPERNFYQLHWDSDKKAEVASVEKVDEEEDMRWMEEAMDAEEKMQAVTNVEGNLTSANIGEPSAVEIVGGEISVAGEPFTAVESVVLEPLPCAVEEEAKIFTNSTESNAAIPRSRFSLEIDESIFSEAIAEMEATEKANSQEPSLKSKSSSYGSDGNIQDDPVQEELRRKRERMSNLLSLHFQPFSLRMLPGYDQVLCQDSDDLPDSD